MAGTPAGLEAVTTEWAEDFFERYVSAWNSRQPEGLLELMTDDIVWDDVTHPLCPVSGKAATANIYSGILDAIPDIHLGTVRRLNFGTHVLDAPPNTAGLEVLDASLAEFSAALKFVRDGLQRHVKSLRGQMR